MRIGEFAIFAGTSASTVRYYERSGLLKPEDRSPRIQQKLLHKALLAEKRATLVRLRDTRLIDDIVLRRVQARLDAEEMRYAAWKTESD